MFFFFPSILDKNFIFFVLGFGVFLGCFFFFIYLDFHSLFFFKIMRAYGGSIWFLQPLSTQGILYYSFFFFYINLNLIDRGYIEYLGGQRLYNFFSLFSFFFNLFTSKSVLVSSVFLFFVVFFFLLVYILSLIKNFKFSS